MEILLIKSSLKKNEVNTALVGTYLVEYSVMDSGGLTTRKTITVTVTQKNRKASN